MAVLGQLGEGVRRWLDAGRSSVLLALALALIVPSVNVVRFDGLPLDDPYEVGAIAVLLPFALSGKMRDLFGDLVRRRGHGPRILIGIALGVVLVKLLLLSFGADRGFVACYVASLSPPEQRCETSYSNLLERHDGATRVDQRIDFGPTTARVERMASAYPTLVYSRGLATTNWNLGFSNDLRFNAADVVGTALHERLPFSVSWHGTAAVPDDGVIEVQYRGVGRLEIGGRVVLLPATEEPRTIISRVSPGDQVLRAEFTATAGEAAPELRLLDQSGEPVVATAPSVIEQAASVLIWFILATAFLVLALVVLCALRSDLLTLAIIVGAAFLLVLISSPSQQEGFQYLVALLVPLLVLRSHHRPMLLAYGALLVIQGAMVLNSVSDIDAVLYRAAGSDFLTYESFAREIVLGHSLSGGEDIFYYQPGSRYVLGLMHLLFGEGDVLVTWWTMIGLSLPFIALVDWHRRKVDNSLGAAALALVGFLLLAVLNSSTVLSLVAMSASEVPSWALLPLAVAAPQLQPRRAGAWVGSAVAASLIWVIRNNQALAAITILTAIFSATWRRRRLVLVAAVIAALMVALLPALHNLAYGDRFQVSTTSNALSQELSLGDLDQFFSDSQIGGELRGHVSSIFYDPPTPGLTDATLRWELWGLLAVWLATVFLGLLRLREDGFSGRRWLLLALPLAYLVPHVVYQVEVYFPRHILAGYLAMGVSSLGVLMEMSPAWEARQSRIAGRLRALWSSVLALPRESALPDTSASAVSRTRGVRNAGVGLCAAAFLAPFSATQLMGSLTVGRTVALAFAALLLIDLSRSRPRSFRIQLPAALALGAYVGLVGWVFLSTMVWGCNCDGKAGGLYEFALIGVLSLAAIGLEPRLRRVAILSMLAGIVAAAALALAGVGSLNSGTVDLTQTGGRLSGTFGNANELGLALALGIPIVLAFFSTSRRNGRIALIVSGAILVTALALTYSRSAIIAAGIGVLAVGLWQARERPRRLAYILGGAAVAIGLAAVLYSPFQQEREEASFASVPSELRLLDQRDTSGWDSRGLGPIPEGPARVANSDRSIAVATRSGGGGISYRWGEASAGEEYILRFRAKSESGGAPLSYALGDRSRGKVSRQRSDLGTKWQEFTLRWRPESRSPFATLFIWQNSGPGAFAIDDVSVDASGGGDGGSEVIAIPNRLRGSLYDELASEATREEDRYVESRLDAAELALRAFRSEPLRGIGWATFPDYADERLEYGQLAVHNQYLSLAAELGIVGVLLILMLIAAVVIGIRSVGPSLPETAAIGMLAAAAVGMVFVEALPVPQLSIPIALAAAVVCAQPRSRSD